MIRRSRQLQAIESAGFEQKSFTSSSNNGKEGQEPDFDFGTKAEKASLDQATKVIEQIENENICHPDWFGAQEERNARWLRYLEDLRKKILKHQ